jgi:hypothetical protein
MFENSSTPDTPHVRLFVFAFLAQMWGISVLIGHVAVFETLTRVFCTKTGRVRQARRVVEVT